jgi:hypothetical protein
LDSCTNSVRDSATPRIRVSSMEKAKASADQHSRARKVGIKGRPSLSSSYLCPSSPPLRLKSRCQRVPLDVHAISTSPMIPCPVSPRPRYQVRLTIAKSHALSIAIRMFSSPFPLSYSLISTPIFSHFHSHILPPPFPYSLIPFPFPSPFPSSTILPYCKKFDSKYVIDHHSP